MADNTRVYEVVNSSPLITTVYDYIQDPDSPAYGYAKDPEVFLDVKNLAGQTNREVIEATYTTKAQKNKYAGKPTREMLLKVGTRLAVEMQKVNRAGLLTQGLEVVSNDVPGFKAKQLADLESKEGYNQPYKTRPIAGKKSKGITVESYPEMTVWIWCRTLASKANNFEGEIFNITPFIQNVCTNVCKTGGNFQITLPPLTAELVNNQWVIKPKSVYTYQNKLHVTQEGIGYVAEGSMFELDADESLVRSQFLFHNLLSTNDVVFIRFETLQMEYEQRIEDIKNLFISKINLPNRIYDMIGLIDVNDQSISPSTNDVTVNISGRDLSKLFIEDGAYFYFLEMTQGMLGGPGSSQTGLTQRLASDQSLQYLNLYFNNSIENVFKFVINQLSNIKVTPNELFSSYAERRNTRYTQATDTNKYSKLDEQTASLKKQSLEQITNIRKQVSLSEVSLQDETRKVNAIYDEQKRFQRDLRTKKIRITEGSETAGWPSFKYINERGVTEKIEKDSFPDFFSEQLYNLRITRVVNEGRLLMNYIDNILDIEDSKSDYQNQFKKELMPGIWQIIKLVIDKGILDRRIVDSSLSTANGPLLNFFQKVCQEPFVEFFMDTYGDMFYLTARKPPTDRAGILSFLNAQINTESPAGTETITPAIIDIEPEDVLHEELTFADNEVISWYHLTPQANFTGGTDAFSLVYLPAVFLPEYADIWGSRPMNIVHNYMPMMPKDPNANGLDVAQKQAVEDMRYLIQSTAYLPFTRRGRIKINGDRRIKYGNLIRYKSTGEIFKVEGVRQDFVIGENQIDRSTSIEVSRGMIEQLIYGVPAVDDNGDTIDGYISYFNIVDTTPVYFYKDVTSYKTETVKVGTKPTNFTKPTLDQKPFTLQDTNIILNSSEVTLAGNQNLQELDAYSDDIKKRWIQLINGANSIGYLVDITSGVRSKEQQLALWRANPNNAKAGHSKHETGLAMDINLINIKTGVRIKKDSIVTTWLSTGVPQLGKQLGMKWGGDSFQDYFDPVHFEINATGNANPIGETEDVFETRQVPVKGKELDVAKIFSNFKVNPHVFNFFLRREQLEKQYLKPTSGYYEQDPQTKQVVKVADSVIIKSRTKL